jgi:hypothetical protein
VGGGGVATLPTGRLASAVAVTSRVKVKDSDCR